MARPKKKEKKKKEKEGEGLGMSLKREAGMGLRRAFGAILQCQASFGRYIEPSELASEMKMGSNLSFRRISV